MRTVSFDFDGTLLIDSPNFGPPIFNDVIVKKLREHLIWGDKVIIVTSRTGNMIQDVKDRLLSIGLTLDVFSAPGSPDFDIFPTKGKVLIDQGVSVHYDDCPNFPSLIAAKNAGIEIIDPWNV